MKYLLFFSIITIALAKLSIKHGTVTFDLLEDDKIIWYEIKVTHDYGLYIYNNGSASPVVLFAEGPFSNCKLNEQGTQLSCDYVALRQFIVSLRDSDWSTGNRNCTSLVNSNWTTAITCSLYADTIGQDKRAILNINVDVEIILWSYLYGIRLWLVDENDVEWGEVDSLYKHG